MNKFKIGLYGFCLILLLSCITSMAGCISSFYISVIGDDPFRPTFRLTKKLLSPPFGKKISVRRFGIFRSDPTKPYGWDYRDPIWGFGLPPDRSKVVAKIEYGKVPTGFEEWNQSKPLVVGVTYLAKGWDGGGFGEVKFRIVERDGSHELLVLDDESGNQGEKAKKPD